MASSGVSNSVRGYGAEFLIAEQQERFTSVKTKLCGNKVVDVADLQKNGMGSVVAAMEKMKWYIIFVMVVSTHPLVVSTLGTYNFCHGSVDTPIGGVDTGSESLKQFREDRVKCVDTAPGSVDTSPRFQKTQLPDWDSVSTEPVVVSTLVSAPRSPVLRK
ncbi:hypothetical protein Taro_044374 [Colocasia esculenta]|uniref:Uncharacterized protein n=1 Tax=Colocasia esculenta TaxID=4460 RepID=A0A843WTV9_COLES|nr:hypothetical protein [Colocasia esculenta]